jgi:hypothetical protein
MAVSEVTLRHLVETQNLLVRACSHRLVSTRCWPVKPKSSLRGFFISDRTDCVNSTPTPAVIEKRVQVRHEVCGPVQIRKNPATGSASKSRVYGIQSVAWKSGMTGGDVQLCSYTSYGVGGSLGDR